MPDNAVEEFARLLVEHVRDAAIRGCDQDLSPAAGTVTAPRWPQARTEEDLALVRAVIPDCVDAAVSQLLLAIDQGLLRLSYTDEGGRRVDLPETGRGELTGWYLGADGWRGRYSAERFADDFGDL
ncbi:hypothetical protein AB0I81_00220 [Nonomuraea sp. NPDC050404]|uniref:hypothetical protein n=1 Tax=Nonomuraea sp. NPDC050404 TaxID=3155783 RepID=UPI0033EA52D6